MTGRTRRTDDGADAEDDMEEAVVGGGRKRQEQEEQAQQQQHLVVVFVPVGSKSAPRDVKPSPHTTQQRAPSKGWTCAWRPLHGGSCHSAWHW